MKSYLLSIFRLDRSILVFIFGWSVIGLVHAGIISVLVNLYVLKIGFDLSFLGLLNGSSQIIWALFAFPAGMLGSRFGLRTCVIAAYWVVTVGLILFLSAAWLPQALWAAGLLIGNGLIGVAAALVSVNGIPYLMAVASERDRSKAFTLQSALFTLSAFLGSLAAGALPGFLADRLPGMIDEARAFNIVMWLAVPAYIFTAFLMTTLRPEPKIIQANKEKAHEAAPLALLLFLGLFFCLQMGSEQSVLMFVNVYFVENLRQPAAIVGVIFAAARLLPFITSPLQPLVLNRWGAGRVLAGGYLLVAVCVLIMALVPTLTSGVILYILFSVIISFTGTARSLFGQEAVQPQWRTASSAVSSVSQAVSAGLIGFGAGSILNAGGFRGMFLIGAVLALIVIPLYMIRQSHAASQQPEEALG
jgi:MFS family permease